MKYSTTQQSGLNRKDVWIRTSGEIWSNILMYYATLLREHNDVCQSATKQTTRDKTLDTLCQLFLNILAMWHRII